MLQSPRPGCRPSTQLAGTSISYGMDRTGWRLVGIAHDTAAVKVLSCMFDRPLFREGHFSLSGHVIPFLIAHLLFLCCCAVAIGQLTILSHDCLSLHVCVYMCVRVVFQPTCYCPPLTLSLALPLPNAPLPPLLSHTAVLCV